MKKLLILVLIVLLLTLCIYIVISGVQIGNIQVLGINEIQAKNAELDQKIQQAGKLAEKDYKQAVATVEESAKKLEEEKKEYEDMALILGEDGDTQIVGQIEKYEIEALWVKLGNHATSEGVVMKMDVVKGGTENTYNLKFTVTGSYISITDFISAIENDSTLGFKIEEFKMDKSQTTFVCKEITIENVSETGTSSEENPDDTTIQNSTNTTNTTQQTSTNTSTGTNANTRTQTTIENTNQ